MFRPLIAASALAALPVFAAPERFALEVQALDEAADLCLVSQRALSNHCRAFVMTANRITKQDVEVWDRYHRGNGDIHAGNAQRYQGVLEKMQRALDLINTAPAKPGQRLGEASV